MQSQEENSIPPSVTIFIQIEDYKDPKATHPYLTSVFDCSQL